MASATGLVPEVGGQRLGALLEQKIPQSLSGARSLCSSAGRLRKRPRCVSASTSVHSKTSGHLFVFVYVRGVHACACVSPASHVSALVFVCMYPGPLSESVAVGVYACLGASVWFCVWKFICVCGLPCVLDCACLRAACNRPLELLVCICRAGWPPEDSLL